MSLFLACYDSPYALARTQLDLVVLVYVTTYLAFVLVGAACLGIMGAFNHLRTRDEGPPAKGGWGTPESDASTFDF
jgi:hypothetical protein